MTKRVADRKMPAFDRHISGRWGVACKIIFCLAVIIVTHESLIPTADTSMPNNWDKLVHFIAYFILMSLAMAAFPRARLIPLFILISGLGGGIEIAQELMNVGRDGSWPDALANILGAAMPALIWRFYRRKR